jgi:hypothetical protein
MIIETMVNANTETNNINKKNNKKEKIIEKTKLELLIGVLPPIRKNLL